MIKATVKAYQKPPDFSFNELNKTNELFLGAHLFFKPSGSKGYRGGPVKGI